MLRRRDMGVSHVPGSQMNWESTNMKLKKREETADPFLLSFSRPANFSRAFHFRV